MKPTLISLFAGIGGLDLAAHWAGFETVRFVEKEPFCQKVLAKHWPSVPIDDDVFTSHPGHADIVVGGFPCQPFSVAGSQRGRDDERFLLPEMLRIVDEVQPYAVLFENVPGFPQLSDGREFKYLLGALAEMGFDAEWGHIRASDIGAPHQRERWFCVAYSNGKRCKTIDAPTFTSDTKQFTRGAHADQPMGNTGSKRCDTNAIATINREMGFNSWRFIQTRGERFDKSTVGRTVNGVSERLDFVGFPARPGQPQFAYEPPRTAPSTSTTNARIKALGNAVVPAVAYPIFASIAEWLTEVHATKAA